MVFRPWIEKLGTGATVNDFHYMCVIAENYKFGFGTVSVNYFGFSEYSVSTDIYYRHSVQKYQKYQKKMPLKTANAESF